MRRCAASLSGLVVGTQLRRQSTSWVTATQWTRYVEGAPHPRPQAERRHNSVQRASNALQLLVPLMEKHLDAGAGATESLASIVTSTAFHASTMSPLASVHDPGCPAAKDKTVSTMEALSRMSGDIACTHCIRRRAHYLASELLANEIYIHSIGGQSSRDAAATNDAFDQALANAFGTRDKALEALALYCMNHREDGWTWLVVRPAKDGTVTLEVLNTPQFMCPQTLGLWPVLAVDMHERAWVYSPRDWEGTPCAAPTAVPSWSRVARLKKRDDPRAQELLRLGAMAGPSELEWYGTVDGQKKRYVDAALGMVDWGFAAEQFSAAAEWFGQRSAAVAEREQVLSDNAVQRAQQRHRRKVEVEAEEEEAPEAARVIKSGDAEFEYIDHKNGVEEFVYKPGHHPEGIIRILRTPTESTNDYEKGDQIIVYNEGDIELKHTDPNGVEIITFRTGPVFTETTYPKAEDRMGVKVIVYRDGGDIVEKQCFEDGQTTITYRDGRVETA